MHGINKAGFIIHGAIHLSHPHLHYVMHTHSRHGVADSMQRHGLLPNSQKALTIMGWVGYHDFEGTATDAGEQPRIVRDLGDRRLLVLRNHGLLSVGETMGEAFVWIYRLETACRHQIDALAGGAGAAADLRRDAGADHRAGAPHVRPRRLRRGRPGMARASAPARTRGDERLLRLIGSWLPLRPTRPDPTRPDPTRPDPTRPDPTRPATRPTRPDPSARQAPAPSA